MRTMVYRTIWLVLVLGTLLVVQAELDISAFNIQTFGRAKMDKPHVVDALKKIIPRYDIVLIQEIRDSTGTAIRELLMEVNSVSPRPYTMSISERLGRTSSKEQYAYFYRESEVSLVEEYQWPDDNDKFERPPFVTRFRTTAGFEFGFAGVHVKPSDAVDEIDALTDVYDGVKDRWNLDDILIGGDLNADCDYVRPGDWPNIRLRTQQRFLWVISDDTDTSLAMRSCAYDRLVLAGSALRGRFIEGSAGAFKFDDALGLNEEDAKEVSDHYPVYMKLRT